MPPSVTDAVTIACCCRKRVGRNSLVFCMAPRFCSKLETIARYFARALSFVVDAQSHICALSLCLLFVPVSTPKVKATNQSTVIILRRGAVGGHLCMTGKGIGFSTALLVSILCGFPCYLQNGTTAVKVPLFTLQERVQLNHIWRCIHSVCWQAPSLMETSLLPECPKTNRSDKLLQLEPQGQTESL